MKFIDCDIIKDLLPSYSDKILSTASNKLVEEHLQTCKNCLKEFQDMNKEIPDEIINNQDEQIDFLKGYRKSKIKSIILAVLLTICVLLSIFIILFIYDKNTEFNYDISQLEIIYRQEYKINEKNILTFDIYNIKNSFKLSEYKVTEDDGSTSIYLKFIGKHPLKKDIKATRTVYDFEIDEKVKRIYIEDTNGNKRKIWDIKTNELAE